MRRESELKAKQMVSFKELNYLCFRIEDKMTKGLPDIFVIGEGLTSWLEVKHGTPRFDSQGIQEKTCLRLAHHGFCRYIIFLEDSDGSNKRTLIVHPRNIGKLEPEVIIPTFNHLWVTNYVRKIHEEYRNLRTVS